MFLYLNLSKSQNFKFNFKAHGIFSCIISDQSRFSSLVMRSLHSASYSWLEGMVPAIITPGFSTNNKQQQ